MGFVFFCFSIRRRSIHPQLRIDWMELFRQVWRRIKRRINVSLERTGARFIYLPATELGASASAGRWWRWWRVSRPSSIPPGDRSEVVVISVRRLLFLPPQLMYTCPYLEFERCVLLVQRSGKKALRRMLLSVCWWVWSWLLTVVVLLLVGLWTNNIIIV